MQAKEQVPTQSKILPAQIGRVDGLI